MPNTPTWGIAYPNASDAPDGPGALYTQALSVEDALQKRRCTLQLNGAVNTNANGGDLPWDTVLSDPSNMRESPGQITAPWTGRYAIGARIALTGSGIPTTENVVIDAINSTNYIFGQVGQFGLPADQPMQYHDEVFINAGDFVRFRIRWTGTSGARQYSYGSDAVRARIWARYLGVS